MREWREWYFMIVRAIRVILRIIFNVFYRVEVITSDKIDFSKKYIICGNHRFANDPFFVSLAYKPDVYILGKKEMFKYKFLDIFFSSLGVFSVDRDNNDIAVLKKSLKALKERSLIIFPEGTRNTTSKPLEAKAGLGLLCVKSKTPILPIAIVNKTNKLFSKVKIYLLDPIDPESFEYEKYTSETYVEIGNNVLHTIYDKFNEEI